MANNSSFPTMGESIAKDVLNMSRGSRYTTTVVKKTKGRGASPTGTYAKRGSSLIHEANGPKCHIQTTLYKQNAAAANDTQRNVRTVPSRISHPDAGFWSKRQYGQGM